MTSRESNEVFMQREARLLCFEPALGAECVRVGEELWVHVREVG